jgi:hypothetical protein
MAAVSNQPSAQADPKRRAENTETLKDGSVSILAEEEVTVVQVLLG